MSLVYAVKEVEVEKEGKVSREIKMVGQEMVAGAARVDIHVHSSASGYIVPYDATKWLGVRECYTKPRTIFFMTLKHPLKSRRMDFVTISDHDVIVAAEDLRQKYPHQAFSSCEYTVSVRKGKAFVHMGIVGLEYPGDTVHPLTRKQVYGLHRELTEVRKQGWENFFEYCDKVGLIRVTNHLALLMSTKKENRLTGKEVYEIAEASKYIEINGDSQLENLVAMELALRLNKPIVAGSDSHTWRRLGHQYTTTTVPARTPYEFIQAFKQGNVGIGSKYPVYVEDPVPSDVMMRAFNGKPFILFQDAVWGHLGYLSRDYLPEEGVKGLFTALREKGPMNVLLGKGDSIEEYTPRKILVTTSFFGVPLMAGVGAWLGAGSVLAGLSSGAGLLGAFLGTTLLIAGVISRQGKKDFAYWTRDLYHDLQRYLADHDTEYLTKLHDRLLGQAKMLESRIAQQENEESRKQLEENYREKMDDALSLENVIRTFKRTYLSKTLRIPHDLVGLRGWLEKIVEPEYDLAERDLAKLLQEPVAMEEKEKK